MSARPRWRRWWEILRYTALIGAEPQVPARSAGIRRLLTAAVLGVGFWAGFVALLTAPAEQQGSPLALALAVATVVPTVVSTRSPLWGWRLLLLLIAFSPLLHPDMTESWGWAWSPGLALCAALVLYLVGQSHTQSVLLCVAAISVTVMAPHVRDWRDLVLLAALTTVPLFLGNTVRQRRLAEQDRLAQQHRRITEETRVAVLEERARIARELHDVVAHHMSVLAVRTDSAQYRFPGLDEGLRGEFAALTDTAREGMVELRRLLGVLRTESEGAPTEPQPDVARIAELVQRVRALGMECSLDVRGDFDGLPAGVALSLYRIVQEALSNAARHSPGAPVSVELAVRSGTVSATIHNGPGETATVDPGGTGQGLLGMRERVAMLYGRLEAGATTEGGFRVVVTIPLDEQKEASGS